MLLSFLCNINVYIFPQFMHNLHFTKHQPHSLLMVHYTPALYAAIVRVPEGSELQFACKIKCAFSHIFRRIHYNIFLATMLDISLICVLYAS